MAEQIDLPTLETAFTRMMGCRLPIVVAPMFLVSNPGMVATSCEHGAIGSFPALNARPVEKLREWLQSIRGATAAPYAVNLIVNRTNIYYKRQMEICLEEEVPMIIASLGDPSLLIEQAHQAGTRVFCDVIVEKHAQKAVDAGADGLVAVCGGAGGHAGTLSSLVWVPYLKRRFDLPVLAAGNIADGAGLAAALALGADAAYMGTRFIASRECPVSDEYKQGIVKANPHDIVATYKLDGVAANVLNTPYVQKKGTQLSWIERLLFRSRKLRPVMMAFRAMRSMKVLTEAARKPTWKELWGAGQVSGLIDDVPSIPEILDTILEEYEEVRRGLPAVEREVAATAVSE